MPLRSPIRNINNQTAVKRPPLDPHHPDHTHTHTNYRYLSVSLFLLLAPFFFPAHARSPTWLPRERTSPAHCPAMFFFRPR